MFWCSPSYVFFSERERADLLFAVVCLQQRSEISTCVERFSFSPFFPLPLLSCIIILCVCVFVFYFNFLLASILHQGSFWLGQDLSRFKPSILVLLFKTSFYFKPLDGKTTLKWTYPRYPLIETKNFLRDYGPSFTSRSLLFFPAFSACLFVYCFCAVLKKTALLKGPTQRWQSQCKCWTCLILQTVSHSGGGRKIIQDNHLIIFADWLSWLHIRHRLSHLILLFSLGIGSVMGKSALSVSRISLRQCLAVSPRWILLLTYLLCTPVLLAYLGPFLPVAVIEREKERERGCFLLFLPLLVQESVPEAFR